MGLNSLSVMVGSVITRPMLENRVYGGCPAVDITDKVGPQFQEISLDEKMLRATSLLTRFHAAHAKHRTGTIKIVAHRSEFGDDDASWFAVEDRVYTKKLMAAEVDFMRFIYPAKFYPMRGNT